MECGLHTFHTINGTTSYNFFGTSVSITDNYVMVGAPSSSARIYHEPFDSDAVLTWADGIPALYRTRSRITMVRTIF